MNLQSNTAFAVVNKLGEALLKWKYVEQNLAILFIGLMEARDFQCSVIVYSALQLNVQVRLIDQLLRHRVTDKDIIQKWTAVKKGLGPLIDKRNKLVHWEFVAMPTNQGQGFEMILTKSIIDSRNLQKGPTGQQFKDTLSEKDIDTMMQEFDKIVDDVMDVHVAVHAHLSSTGHTR